MMAVDICVPTEPLDRSCPETYQDKLRAQIQFLERASLPGNYQLFSFQNEHAHSSIHRLVRPYTNGKSIDTYFMNVASRREIGYMIYLMATALQQIHQKKGILHGNINVLDVWVYDTHEGKPAVAFLKFQYAYYLSQPTAVCEDNGRFLYWAPERRQRQRQLAPHVNQDIYSFGFLLEQLLDKWQQNHLKYASPRKYFPSIDKFIQQSLAEDPNARPELSIFIQELFIESRVDLLLKALQKNEYLFAYNVFEEFHKECPSELVGRLLFCLIQYKNFDKALNVMNKRHDISICAWVTHRHNQNALHLLFSECNGHLNRLFLVKFCQYYSQFPSDRPELLSLLSDVNAKNETPIDLALKHNHVALIQSMFLDESTVGIALILMEYLYIAGYVELSQSEAVAGPLSHVEINIEEQGAVGLELTDEKFFEQQETQSNLCKK